MNGGDEVTWRRLYERASVDRFLADMEAERGRLQAEIEVAQAQRDAARQVVAARQTDAQAELGALVLSCEREMAELETAHREVLDTIREAADAEAARVLAAAHREVEAMRDIATSLAPLVTDRGAADANDSVSANRTNPRDRADAS